MCTLHTACTSLLANLWVCDRYGIQAKDFWNTTLNPTEAWQYYNFAPSGMQNLTQVATLPLFLSKPHFLDGDSSLLASVQGLHPVRGIHDTYLDIEPNTGALCRVHNRAQVNMLYRTSI